MTPERWQRVKTIFQAAIERAPGERDLFLVSACGDDAELRGEVESLIASHEKSGEFIDAPAYQAAAEIIVDSRAELKPGQTIGSYEIVSFLSRGGMGEVYLAQDRRLSRKVALKILPASFTKDHDRLGRFEQEARAASALNHPNIITIYEILETNSTHMIATEFVEGENLRHRLSQSGLPLMLSLNIAIQVADALAAAHKAGIIHRDIKPENIMLRPDGYVKVLDFGLAKLSEEMPPAVSAEAPTRQVKTGSGIVMGTAGYMSPEQARGKDVDARTDIFSLGAVIYEMVAHRKPFEGETPNDTLAAILKTDPEPLSRRVPSIPHELNRIVTKALRKDREERYQVIKELLIDLRTLQRELDFQNQADHSQGDRQYQATNSISVADPTSASGKITSHRSAISDITNSLSIEIKRHKAATAVTLLVIVWLTAGIAFGLYKLLSRHNAVAHFQNVKLTRLTNSGNAIDAIISPDGKYIVYALSNRSQQSLWIRQVSTANDKEIVPPAPVGFFGLAFSRDGTELYYAVKANLDAGTLYRVPVFGGTPVKILEKIDGPISFAPDGKRFVLVRGNFPSQGESSLVIANIDGSNERTLATRKLPEKFVPIFFTGPSWSSDGELIASSITTIGGSSRVALFKVATGAEAPFSKETWPYTARVEWLPDMSGILVVAGDLAASAQVWFLSYPEGEKRQVTNDLNAYRALTATADGHRFTTVQASGLINVWVAPEGDAARAVQLPTGNIGFYASNGNPVSWTPDGRIAFISNESGASDVWLMDPDGKNRKQITTGGGLNTTPVPTADGRFIVFASLQNGVRNIWRMNSNGSNPIRLTNGLADGLPAISPDSKWVVYTSLAQTKATLWKISIEGGAAQQLSDHVAISPTISPDGRSIAFLFPESQDPFAPPNRIGIMSFPDGALAKTFTIPASGTVYPVVQWPADGRSILFSINQNNVTNIWSQPVDGGEAKQLTSFKDSLMTGFAWSRDGKQLACTRGVLMRDGVLITDLGK
jgi:serine/threonine protein kinase